jgi:predicted HicB family RNase H-like nuclease
MASNLEIFPSPPTSPVAPAEPAASPEAAAILQVAERLHAMNPDWVVFFREVLGVEGIVRRSFRTAAELTHFECSPQYARIREMLDDLRSRQRDRPASRESQRVVTVRMPRSLHESLKAEAEGMRVSINTLCISKLLKLLDEEERKDLATGRGEDAQAG